MSEDYVADLSPQKNKVGLRILEIDPAKVDVVVKVQEELNGNYGIKREGTLAYTFAGRDKRHGDKDIRDSTITYHDHISRFEANDPEGKKVVAFVGNGNLLMNPWFVAWIKGELFHLKDEPVETRNEPYSSLVVWKEKRVSIENIWFRNNRVRLDSPEGKDITEEVLYTTYGQRLVERGQFVAPFQIRDQYYDLRHLLLFPFFTNEEGYFGLNQLETNAKKREDALKKLPVELDLNVDQRRAGEALKEKHYQDAGGLEKVTQEGQYHISDERIRIVFKSGLFPHNIIATTENYRVASLVVTGWSNTAGLMLDKADRLFEDLKKRWGIRVIDAILLDNGGDVMMQYRGAMIAQSFISPPRDRLRSVVLFAAYPGAEEGARLIDEV